MNNKNRIKLLCRYSLLFLMVALVLVQLAVELLAQDDDSASSGVGVAFVEQSSEFGVDSFTPTFGYMVADFNNDGRDDILGSHHGKSPVLLINVDGQRFEDFVYLLDLSPEKDVHCPAAADIDNDGDVDIILAGGGEGFKGARGGTPNQLFRNMLVETGEFAFEAIDASIDYPAWRTRALIPHPSPNGKNINLLMQCIEDTSANKPNLYFQPANGKDFRFRQIRNNGLMERAHTEGNGFFVDIDNDNDVDLLTVVDGIATIYYYESGRFEKVESALDPSGVADSITAGDLNNDGLLDIIVGRAAIRSGNDIFTVKKSLIQFDFNLDESVQIDTEELDIFCDCDNPKLSIAAAGRDDVDAFSFSSKGDEIQVNFAYKNHKIVDDPSIVFIGKDAVNPESAETVITSESAFGRPNFDKAGVYIWFAQERWNVYWLYSNRFRAGTGQIFAKRIGNVETEYLEPSESESTQDLVFLNKGDGTFERLEIPVLEHQMITQALLALDFDNSGTVDIAVLRRGPRMAENGDPELFLNAGVDESGIPWFVRHDSKEFQSMDNDAFSSESLIAGFFDDNLFYDLFSTNGQGLKPNEGPRHLFINATINENDALVVRLEPTESNKDALGTKVWLKDRDGHLLGYREVFYQGRNQLNARNVHFGLGPKEKLNAPLRAYIRWPNGTGQDEQVKPGKISVITEKQ